MLDPAMGSGHFLVEACRFLGDALYEACRLCDERAGTAEEGGNTALATELRARVEALPDPNNELLDWLPSRAPEGTAGGLSQQRALALCRRLVAVHCLYGVDKNRMAVELAKLSLWLESYAEGLPLTFMNHRLICGDSLTGPFLEHLFTLPRACGPIGDDLFTQGLRERLGAALATALRGVRDLTTSVGKNVADLEQKASAKDRLDAALAPFRTLAAAWSGAVMLGDEGDDEAYLRALKATAAGVEWSSDPLLARMIEAGSGGVVYDLAFPEVFHPDGVMERKGGFDAVVGNPPWEGVDTSTTEFFGALDIRILDLDGQAAKDIVQRLLGTRGVAETFSAYVAGVESTRRMAARTLAFVNRSTGQISAATLDLYQAFWERGVQLNRAGGKIGMVLPSAFHANEGATGLRRLSVENLDLECCYSFENRYRLFDIHGSFKFALVVLRNRRPRADGFSVAFYLHHLDWLFTTVRSPPPLTYSATFLRRTTGEFLNFLELRRPEDVAVAETMFGSKQARFGDYRRLLNVLPTEELHTSKQKHRAVPLESTSASLGDPRQPPRLDVLTADGLLPVLKGEHFHQYDPSWGPVPNLVVPISNMVDKQARIQASRFYRLVFRRQARSTDERTIIANLSVPGLLYFDSALPEKAPDARPTMQALTVVALGLAFPFDWLVRQLVAANVTFNFLDTVPVPSLEPYTSLIVHSSLRLTCNHAGYAPLWTEQVGEVWREPTTRRTWPVLSGDNARWAVRAAIDAVVADAYGLSREQYTHVLGSFSHKSYPNAPALCLAAFDELKAIGLDAFTKKHDPYHDIPLNEALPKPVIDFGPSAATGAPSAGPSLFPTE